MDVGPFNMFIKEIGILKASDYAQAELNKMVNDVEIIVWIHLVCGKKCNIMHL